MQIRCASRSDDKKIRDFLSCLLEKGGKILDLDGVDQDLKNIEESYFAQEGAFLLLEEDGLLKGIAAGKKIPQQSGEDFSEVFLIRRIELALDLEYGQNYARRLYSVLANIAKQGCFKTILLSPEVQERYSDLLQN